MDWRGSGVNICRVSCVCVCVRSVQILHTLTISLLPVLYVLLYKVGTKDLGAPSVLQFYFTSCCSNHSCLLSRFSITFPLSLQGLLGLLLGGLVLYSLILTIWNSIIAMLNDFFIYIHECILFHVLSHIKAESFRYLFLFILFNVLNCVYQFIW